jgi:hypothetical protein
VDFSKHVQESIAELARLTFVLVLLFVSVGAVSANDSQIVDQERVNGAELNVISPFSDTRIVAAGSDAGVSGTLQSQQIIATLSEAVENLSRQLSRKDQQIEFLERQINEFERHIGGDQATESPTFLSIQPESSSETEHLLVNELAVKQSITLWQWALLCFLALCSLAYLMRIRLYTSVKAQTLFGSSDHVEFNSAAEQRPTEGTITRFVARATADQGILEGGLCQNLTEKDSPAVNGSLADDAGHALRTEASVVIEDPDDLSFDQRFELLLSEKDFAFARELLDFTRYNEINDERYHCERLRLFEKMQDEDGFYAYYYGIESKIPTFPEHLQTQISQLVVMLAQR